MERGQGKMAGNGAPRNNDNNGGDRLFDSGYGGIQSPYATKDPWNRQIYGQSYSQLEVG